jgi:hypothetical protein
MRLFNRNREMADAKGSASRSVIESRLAQCVEALRAADANLSRLSLEAVTSGEDAQALAAQAHLRQLENQHGLLVAALVECERQDQDRQKELRAAANVSQRRAFNQHAGRFNRDAADVAKAIADLRDAQARLEASGGSIVSLLPNHLRSPANPIHEALSPSGLAGRIAVEQFRLKREGQPPRPGFTYEDNATGRIAPLTEVLAALVSQIREQFDAAPTPPIAPGLCPLDPESDAPVPEVGSGPLPIANDRDAAAIGSQGRLKGVAVSLGVGRRRSPNSLSHLRGTSLARAKRKRP